MADRQSEQGNSAMNQICPEEISDSDNAKTSGLALIDRPAFPRLRMKQRFADACCRLIKARPETSHDNFLRDFGERFVPGYKAVSTVDLLMNAPFDE
jgi:hypothetical protein